MTSGFPPAVLYANELNELSGLLDDVEAEIDEDEKDGIIRRALAKSCNSLRRIDRQGIQSAVRATFDAARPSEARAIIRDDEQFNRFLDEEERLLALAGIDEGTKMRLAVLIRQARSYAAEETPDPEEVSLSIAKLREEVCGLKDQLVRAAREEEEARIQRERQVRALKLCTRTLAVGLIVINATASVTTLPFLPAATPAMLAASVTVGSAYQLIP